MNNAQEKDLQELMFQLNTVLDTNEVFQLALMLQSWIAIIEDVSRTFGFESKDRIQDNIINCMRDLKDKKFTMVEFTEAIRPTVLLTAHELQYLCALKGSSLFGSTKTFDA